MKNPHVANAFLTMLLLAAHEYFTANYKAIVPQQVKLSLTNYAEASFVYSDFVSEVCVLGADKYINSSLMHEYYSAYYNGKCDGNTKFVGRMTKRFDRRRRGAGGPYCYIGIDVDVKKLQDVIVNRKTFHLTLNVLSNSQHTAQQTSINAQSLTPVALKWVDDKLAEIRSNNLVRVMDEVK